VHRANVWVAAARPEGFADGDGASGMRKIIAKGNGM
jgi:hypothetical protein